MKYKRELIILKCDRCGEEGPVGGLSTFQGRGPFHIMEPSIYYFKEYDRDLCFNCFWSMKQMWRGIAVNLYLAGVASLVLQHTSELPKIRFENTVNGHPMDEIEFEMMPKPYRDALIRAIRQRTREAIRRGHVARMD